MVASGARLSSPIGILFEINLCTGFSGKKLEIPSVLQWQWNLKKFHAVLLEKFRAPWSRRTWKVPKLPPYITYRCSKSFLLLSLLSIVIIDSIHISYWYYQLITSSDLYGKKLKPRDETRCLVDSHKDGNTKYSRESPSTFAFQAWVGKFFYKTRICPYFWS